jgi:hypothetical protein
MQLYFGYYVMMPLKFIIVDDVVPFLLTCAFVFLHAAVSCYIDWKFRNYTPELKSNNKVNANYFRFNAYLCLKFANHALVMMWIMTYNAGVILSMIFGHIFGNVIVTYFKPDLVVGSKLNRSGDGEEYMKL